MWADSSPKGNWAPDLAEGVRIGVQTGRTGHTVEMGGGGYIGHNIQHTATSD